MYRQSPIFQKWGDISPIPPGSTPVLEAMPSKKNSRSTGTRKGRAARPAPVGPEISPDDEAVDDEDAAIADGGLRLLLEMLFSSRYRKSKSLWWRRTMMK